jgi:1,6-anhydro-N-acetylmuramate kinase
LRIRAKERVLADNVARSLRSLDEAPAELLLVGGAAADEELLTLVRRRLPGIAVGRADVAGSLGHRHAVAYGLVLLASA